MNPDQLQILSSGQIRGADGSCPRLKLDARPQVPIPKGLLRPGIQGRAEVSFVVSAPVDPPPESTGGVGGRSFFQGRWPCVAQL